MSVALNALFSLKCRFAVFAKDHAVSMSEIVRLSFRRKRRDDFFEARIAAKRVPERQQFQGAVAQHLRCGGSTQPQVTRRGGQAADNAD
jgi:hypothetical protein